MDENLMGTGLDVATLTADVPEPIITLSGGSNYTVSDTADYPLIALNIYGNSVQEGTPTPETPATIVSVGNNGFDLMVKGTYNINGIAWRTQGEIITRQPTSAIAKVDESVIFSVEGGTSYQWQQNTGGGWSDIATATGRSKSFSIAGALFRDGYKYRCVVTDSNGNSETSDVSTLYVVSVDSNVVSGAIPSFALSPLCRVGDDYDELIYSNDGTGKIIRRTKKLVLDGSDDEGWVVSASNTRIQLPNLIKGKSVTNADYSICLCNRLKSVTPTQTYNGVEGISLQNYENASALHICIASLLDNYDLTVWKNWLAENPITVIYQLATPEVIELSVEEMTALSNLRTFEGASNIFNSGNAEMALRVLRREFSMKYVEWIEESQTWICPKAGKWKVICVGGGASGGVSYNGAKILYAAGGTTSFGSILSADGGATASYKVAKSTGGQNGYDGISYGGSPFFDADINSNIGVGLSETAHGYGGGGACIPIEFKVTGLTSNPRTAASSGLCGKIKTTIVDIDEGQSIFVTVGKGGKLTITDEAVKTYIMGANEEITSVETNGAEFISGAKQGADGVVIAQYLGY